MKRSTFDRWFFLGGFLMSMMVWLLVVVGKEGRERPRPVPVLEVDSKQLYRTRVVPTLDAVMEPGTNLIWCASFQLAWKELASSLRVVDLTFDRAEPFSRALNESVNPREFMPRDNYVAFAGEVGDEAIQRSMSEVQSRFPDANPAGVLAGLPVGSLVAYAYVGCEISFPIPYLNSPGLEQFFESGGNRVPIRTFGIPELVDSGGAVSQLKILFADTWESVMQMAENESTQGKVFNREFAVDLCRNSPGIRLVLAKVKPHQSLKDTVDHAIQRIGAGKEVPFEGIDSLLVPEMNWHIFHHFGELEGAQLTTSALKGQPLLLASQDIRFRLDRTGVALRSEAVLGPTAVPMRYEFRGPFLLLVRKRGADHPFFVAWIDNAELLRKLERMCPCGTHGIGCLIRHAS